VNEGALLQITLTASDPDGNTLSYSMANAPAGAALAAGQFSWTPDYSQAGAYTITFYATDNGTPQLLDSATITITVTNVNIAPMLTSPGDQKVDEGALLQLTLVASDPDGNTLSYSMANGPAGATLTGSQFSWTPTYAQAGEYTVTFYVSDNQTPALQDSAKITITVIGDNAPPVIDDPGNQEGSVGVPVEFKLSATDPDLNNFTFSMANAPDGATLTGELFSWTPKEGQEGNYNVSFHVTDDGTPPKSDSVKVLLRIR
jgi:hypothetical protein